MNRSGWSRLHRHLIAAVVLVLGAGLLTLPTAWAGAGAPSGVAARPGSTTLSGFSTARASLRLGGELSDTVTVLPRSVRRITVQYRRAGARRFHNASSATTSPRGVLTLGLRPPSTGTWQFRAVVAGTRSSARFASSTRMVRAAGRAAWTTFSGFDTSAVTVTPGRAVDDDVRLLPRSTRSVAVQARRPARRAS